MRAKTLWLTGWAVMLCLPNWAQLPPKIDSLEKLLTQSTSWDTLQVLNHNALVEYYLIADLEQALYHTRQMLEGSEALEYGLGKGLANLNFATYHRLVQNNDSAAMHYHAALSYLDASTPAKWRAKTYSGLGNLYSLFAVDSAEFYFRDAAALLESQVPVPYSLLFSVQSNWARLELVKGNFQGGLDLLLIADSVNKLSPKPDALASYYVLLSAAYRYLGDYEKAIEACFLGIEECERTNNTKDIYDHYMNLGSLKYIIGDMEGAMEYSAKALPLIEARGDRRALGNLVYNMGVIAQDSKKYDLAISYYRQSEQINREINNVKLLAYSFTGLSSISLIIKKYDQAYDYAEEVVTTAEGINDLQLVASGYHWMSEARAFQGRFAEAYELLEESQRRIDTLSSPDMQMKVYEAFITVDSLSGDLGSALSHLRLYNALKDSLLSEEKTKQIAELETKYETEKTERELERVTQEASIQTLELQRTQLRLVLLGVGLVAVLLAGGLVTLRNRQARLSLTYKAQDVEQNLLRTQMNPHFIFNAMTAIQDVIRQGDAKKASRYLTKFAKLTRQVLDNSRTEFVPLEQEVALLENYLSLQNLRRVQPYQYEVTVAEDLDPEEVLIPPMFAQPFVENAIEHGLADVGEEGEITVSFGRQGDKLLLTVKDNGKGLVDKGANETSGHISHATQITRERIALYRKMTKEDITFAVKEQQPGVKVTFVLPYQLT
ncbi:MAG TPA: hypothetical protein DCE41_17520 [Cytophagales bacterium]|nr:hypothetical protein [Cytophagales bacterium]HAA23868.1 hypothetical protein [Cytophagales bacterium]HAP64454.1 hypothetical protein [Cytophagales bacterium]